MQKRFKLYFYNFILSMLLPNCVLNIKIKFFLFYIQYSDHHYFSALTYHSLELCLLERIE